MIIFRKATINDSDFIFKLRNDESVRAVSLRSEPISIVEHKKWLAAKLANANSVLLIVEFEGAPVAQVRFDKVAIGEAEVSVAVSLGYRGRGLGSEILKASSKKFFEEFKDVMCISALIKKDNIVSMESFAKAGYIFGSETKREGCACIRMILTRSI